MQTVAVRCTRHIQDEIACSFKFSPLAIGRYSANRLARWPTRKRCAMHRPYTGPLHVTNVQSKVQPLHHTTIAAHSTCTLYNAHVLASPIFLVFIFNSIHSLVRLSAASPFFSFLVRRGMYFLFTRTVTYTHTHTLNRIHWFSLHAARHTTTPAHTAHHSRQKNSNRKRKIADEKMSEEKWENRCTQYYVVENVVLRASTTDR